MYVCVCVCVWYKKFVGHFSQLTWRKVRLVYVGSYLFTSQTKHCKILKSWFLMQTFTSVFSYSNSFCLHLLATVYTNIYTICQVEVLILLVEVWYSGTWSVGLIILCGLRWVSHSILNVCNGSHVCLCAHMIWAKKEISGILIDRIWFFISLNS